MAGFYFQINIGNIQIGSIGNASAFNVGRNYLKEFDSMTKTNQGLGNIFGSDNTFPRNTNYVEDPDGVDMLWGSQNDKKKDSVP